MPTIISEDLELEGAIVSKGEVQLNGSLRGDLETTTVTIGQTGKIVGNVVAESVIIRGEVTGSIRGVHVQLAETARVEGDIVYCTLSVEERARLNGQLRHAENPTDARTPRLPAPNGAAQDVVDVEVEDRA